MLCGRCLRASAIRHQAPIILRKISTTRTLRDVENPILSTPVTKPGEAASKQPVVRSSCPEGTVFTGLNFIKGKEDPVAKQDEDYPEWLWSCLEVTRKTEGDATEDLGDEFSKSKKQRRLAAKRQKDLEARLLAEGNLQALAPKVPLQHQSINLMGEEGGTLEHNIAAAEQREELRKVMRKERKAKIKESNYLKSM